MDVHISEPATPSLQSYNSLKFSKSSEDSGYHTSFTPSSLELTRISNETPSLLSPKIVITGNFNRDRRHNYSTLSSTINEYVDELTLQKRGVKRPYEIDFDSTNTSQNSLTATPTSIIAGEIQKLVFDDKQQNFSIPDEHIPFESYPTTPVKKVCKDNCKLSPFNRRKFSRKEEFATHSLSCEHKALQPAKNRKYRGQAGISKITNYKPNKKFDIIKSLFETGQVPLKLILNYFTNDDIYNILLVSHTWQHVWKSIIGKKNKKKQEYDKYLDAVSSNVENWENGIVPKLPDIVPSRTLREIHNETRPPPSSPPGTPRTNRFKKFARAASVDTRAQLSCVQCQYPAKVTEEVSGEPWAECTNSTCAYQFCKSCKGKRHPGKSCLQYDLNDPSPSKRKNNLYPISSKKSKRNLCRLLF
ncbi:uncharacterized protein LOC106135439 [Amyelois transitella]|uniref:uncharacterized protein LOC106135439 n=1 Tax=Amyelois transitella TaxID=680683 RepID=UPI0029905B03|nr:uncharacterized protein LOC106135439 [Amyelois transitella]